MNSNKQLRHKIIDEIVFILLLALSVFCAVAVVTHSNLENPFSGDVAIGGVTHNAAGTVGAYLSDVFLSIFGLTAYLLPIALIWFSLSFHNKQHKFNKLLVLVRFVGFIVLLLSSTAFSNIFPEPSGGWLGTSLHQMLMPLFGNASYILYLGIMLIAYTTASNRSWTSLFLSIKNTGLWFFNSIAKIQRSKPKPNKKNKKTTSITDSIRPKSKIIGKKAKPPVTFNRMTNPLPILDLLAKPSTTKVGYSAQDLEQMGQRVVDILADFGFEITIGEINPGPVVTQFEVSLAPGVKLSQITNLSKDLARALLVESVRIVDVIPGKPVIGIEIPNAQREMISLQEILSTPEFKNSNAKLTMGLGKNINGNPVIANLAKMPHLLVAGATGMGKSVGLNAIILSVLYKSTPDEVRLIMIDPKIVELAIYANIPHLLTPVVTNMNEAASALWWCVNEMERRYLLLAKFGVRNIDGFNEKLQVAKAKGKPLLDPDFNPATADENETAPELKSLPLIMVVIDEYADMLGALAQEDRTKSKRVEGFIIRLAQKARAAGIHLIIATQRPSVDVITGLIKSNIPSRIAFKVSSKVDSRTILDQGGAEQLLGMGDMLYMTPGSSTLTRVHGAFVDDDEINRVVAFLQENYETSYQQNVLNTDVEQSDGQATNLETSGETDPLYDQAVEVITSSRRASISSLQRRMRIGYNRAARIIEDMEAAGVVSPMNSAGNRQVLAPEPIKHD